MAQKSTVFKAKLNLADTDRGVYGDYPLTLARHPSETDTRLMLRVYAFARHAAAGLAFGRGISTDDEPDLWLQDDVGTIQLWIELGTPDPDRLRKASARAEKVVLYAYGDRSVPVWWNKHQAALQRFSNLELLQMDDASCQVLAAMAAPGMELQCTITDGEAWFSDGSNSIALAPTPLV